MIAIGKICMSYFPQYTTKAISTVASFAINFFTTLLALGALSFETLYKIPLHTPLDWASCLSSWQSQAFYLRTKLVCQTVYNFFTEAAQKKVIADQKTTITTLQDNLAQANQTIAALQQDNLKKRALVRQLINKNAALKKALEEDQLSTYRVTIQKEITTQEQPFIELLASFYAEYKALKNTPSSLIHLINSLIPSWQTHLQAHCHIMEKVTASTSESFAHKTLMIKLHELAKRPLRFTELLAKFCLVLTPQPLKTSIDELDPSASLDPQDPAFIEAITGLQQELLH